MLSLRRMATWIRDWSKSILLLFLGFLGRGTKNQSETRSSWRWLGPSPEPFRLAGTCRTPHSPSSSWCWKTYARSAPSTLAGRKDHSLWLWTIYAHRKALDTLLLFQKWRFLPGFRFLRLRISLCLPSIFGSTRNFLLCLSLGELLNTRKISSSIHHDPWFFPNTVQGWAPLYLVYSSSLSSGSSDGSLRSYVSLI